MKTSVIFAALFTLFVMGANAKPIRLGAAKQNKKTEKVVVAKPTAKVKKAAKPVGKVKERKLARKAATKKTAPQKKSVTHLSGKGRVVKNS